MSEKYLKCKICNARKQKEFRNITDINDNIYSRHYDNINHDNEIFTTDVTY